MDRPLYADNPAMTRVHPMAVASAPHQEEVELAPGWVGPRSNEHPDGWAVPSKL